MTPLETYLRELRDIRSLGAGVKEASYYPALSNLLNEVGRRLKPRVRCVINLANRGAGLRDGGLFTADQFQKRSDTEPLPGQPPARGVIEVKSTKDDAWTTADGAQVSRYWGKYRQVLVTNYRDFVLVGQDTALEATRADLAPGRTLASAIKSGSVESRLSAYFDPTAFVQPTAYGDFGQLGRNIIVGPGQVNTDFSIIKFIPVTEHQRVEFRSEFFNLFNNVNFENPVNVVSSANFGQIAAISTGPRVIQFALKYDF